ncbi:pilus assembly PilX family protein [Ramlibacter sp. MAHUQ-53]
MRRPAGHPRRRQSRGLALVVGLVILVVVMVLGLAALRLGAMEERMAGYAQDRSLAFQAAEAALREAEALVDAIQPMPTAGAASACTDVSQPPASVRACTIPAPQDTPRWTDTAFTGWRDATTVGSGTLAVTPQYFAEYLGNEFPCGDSPDAPRNCRRYRITARAGGNGRAAVMLQSVYAID